MDDSKNKFRELIKKAKNTVGILEEQLYQVRLKLQKNPNDEAYLLELKKITLDMTHVLSELDKYQHYIEKKIKQNN